MAIPRVPRRGRSTVALLVTATLLGSSNAHALPRPTPTVPLRELDVVPWPLQPTEAPALGGDLLRRQFNTVCGYIGGDAALPATCSAGSHCAADSQNGVIGCCPDEGPCTQGVFTGCVDENSDAQTEINPYVYTCSGGDVCYKNEFDGGFIQYGCGSTSALANTVAVTRTDLESLSLEDVSVDLTAPATTLSEPTTIGTRPRSTDTASSASSTSTTSSSASSTSSATSSSTSSSETASDSSSSPTTSSSSTSNTDSTSTGATDAQSSTGAADAPDNEDDDSETNVGAIVGGSLGGLAGIALLLALGVWFWRRRSRNSRTGPGMNQDTEYLTPMTDNRQYSPMPTYNDRQMFSQLPTTWEEHEPTTPPLAHAGAAGHGAGNIASHYESNSSGSARGVAVGGIGPYEADREPLTGELDDFSRGFNTAIDDIEGDDDARPNGQGMSAYPGPRGGGDGPLWQQHRRRSRNLMWM